MPLTLRRQRRPPEQDQLIRTIRSSRYDTGLARSPHPLPEVGLVPDRARPARPPRPPVPDGTRWPRSPPPGPPPDSTGIIGRLLDRPPRSASRRPRPADRVRDQRGARYGRDGRAPTCCRAWGVLDVRPLRPAPSARCAGPDRRRSARSGTNAVGAVTAAALPRSYLVREALARSSRLPAGPLGGRGVPAGAADHTRRPATARVAHTTSAWSGSAPATWPRTRPGSDGMACGQRRRPGAPTSTAALARRRRAAGARQAGAGTDARQPGRPAPPTGLMPRRRGGPRGRRRPRSGSPSIRLFAGGPAQLTGQGARAADAAGGHRRHPGDARASSTRRRCWRCPAGTAAGRGSTTRAHLDLADPAPAVLAPAGRPRASKGCALPGDGRSTTCWPGRVRAAPAGATGRAAAARCACPAARLTEVPDVTPAAKVAGAARSRLPVRLSIERISLG